MRPHLLRQLLGLVAAGLLVAACVAGPPTSAAVITSMPIAIATETVVATSRVELPTGTPPPYPPPFFTPNPPSPTETRLPESAYPARPTVTAPTPTAVVYPLMPTRVIGLQFIDPAHGWLIGESTVGPNDSRAYAMAASSDGGLTWNAIPIPPINPKYDWQLPGGFYFATQKDGWFYYRGLFATHDGGLTWDDEKPGGTIVRMDKATDGSLSALEQDARGSVLWQVSIAPYAQWRKAAMKFPIPLVASRLTLADAQHGWLVYWDSSQPSPNYEHLLATDDGGANWRTLPDPCSAYPANGSNLVALDRRNLWLGCGWPWGAGSGSKVVYDSSDGGATWVTKGKGVGTLDDSLSTIGYFSELGAVSPSFAYMTWDRTLSIVLTRDGGATWQYSRLPCSAESTRAIFIDPLHGWAFDQTCVNITIDGARTWICTVLPDNKPC